MVMAFRTRTYCSPYGATQTPGGGGGGGGGTPSGPVITVQPSNQSVDENNTFAFSVTATGVAPLSYAWCEWTDAGPIQIPGGTATSWGGTATAALNGKRYRVQVTDANGKWVWSNVVTLTVNSTNPYTVPVFTTQPPAAPQFTVLTQGTLYAAASGNPTPTLAWQEYVANQWQTIVSGLGGSAGGPGSWGNFSGENTSTLVLGTGNTLKLVDNGRTFRCYASNSMGTAASTSSVIAVNQGSQNENLCQIGCAQLTFSSVQCKIQTDVSTTGLTQYRPGSVTSCSTDNGYAYESFGAMSYDSNFSTGSKARVETVWGQPSQNGDSVFTMGVFLGFSAHTFVGAPNLKIVWGANAVMDGKTAGGALNQSVLQLQIYNNGALVSTQTWTGASTLNALAGQTTSIALPSGFNMIGGTSTQLSWTLFNRADKSQSSDQFSSVTINEIYIEGT